MTNRQRTNYQAYLLRLWRERDAAPWRATIENPHTGERRSFAGLGQLVCFLEEQIGERLVNRQEDDEGGGANR